MKSKPMIAGIFILVACFQAHAQPPVAPQLASGSMDVVMTPASASEKEGRTATGRMMLDKHYGGDLVATGKGEMLTAMTDTKGSAAYVAMERVIGTLHGKSGSFVIVHRGVMRGEASQLTVDIVPDSGTGQLAGISGTMSFKRVERHHMYQLDYVLP